MHFVFNFNGVDMGKGMKLGFCKTQIRIVIINLLNLLRFFCRLTDIYLLMDFEIR